MEPTVVNEQTETTTQSAEAQERTGVSVEEVSLGKFKDVTALLNAYNSLQAEFTKRCQRVKELESLTVAADKTQVPTETEKSEASVKTEISENDKEEILKGYLSDLLGAKRRAVVISGSGVGTVMPAERPKSLAEAGKLAEKIFKQ